MIDKTKWRYLRVGEVIDEGDEAEYWCKVNAGWKTTGWVPTGCVGDTVPIPHGIDHAYYRRRIDADNTKWRLLKKGEEIKKGDQFDIGTVGDPRWIPTGSVGDLETDPRFNRNRIYRRRIEG